MAYYRAHYSHVNIQGRNFYADHKLLDKIYEDLEDEIDTIAEIIRTLDEKIPEGLSEIIALSDVSDIGVIDDGDGDEYLNGVLEDLAVLVSTYQRVEEESKDLNMNYIANYCQDRIRELEKWSWMLRSTLVSRK
jgi:starvation-inducible DNA-binding protein